MPTASELETITATERSLRSDTVSFLQELIRTPSENPPAEYSAIRELLVEAFEEFGWDTTTVWADEELLADLGLDSARPNVLAYVTRGDGPTIALNAHLDTVPADKDKWTKDPFGGEIDEGCVWGRGAKDSKGRIASYTLAARILEESDLLPENATIVVAITCDEETGAEAGAGYVVESGALQPDYAIVEGPVDKIWRAASGVLRPEVTVSGESAHAGTRPEQGSNAIVGAARIIDAVDRYADELSERRSEIANVNNPTCVPTIIEGGVKSNVVPAECSFTVDMRVPPDFDIETSEQEFVNVVESVSIPDGARVDIDMGNHSIPYEFGADEPHVRALKRNADEILEMDVPVVGTRGSTDARWFALHSTKCVNYGPGDDDSNAHAPDEHVEIDQVTNVGSIVAASILDVARAE